MNVNNGHYYNYYTDKKKHTSRQVKQPIQPTPTEKKLDLLQEIMMIANKIDARLTFIEQLDDQLDSG